jgi:hypothetical protein
MAREIVQSLWIGDRLSVMEQLCIRSFLDHGHPFHLYTYQQIANIPEGTEVRDGTEILPAREIFVYRRGCGKGSPSAFSNVFRYRLLLERGGWWADLDACCTRPLEFPDEHVVGYERERDGTPHVNCGLMRAPAGSPIARFCWSECQKIDRAKVRWGQIGPRLTARAIRQSGTPVRLLPPDAFYPIDYVHFHRLVRDRRVPAGCYSIHLWNSRWRREGLDPDAIYPPDCIYEQLKRRHGIRSPEGARRGDARLLGSRFHFVRKLVFKLRRAAGLGDAA